MSKQMTRREALWGISHACVAATIVLLLLAALLKAFAGERIEVDLSRMVGSPVAFTAPPITNKLVLGAMAEQRIEVQADPSPAITNGWSTNGVTYAYSDVYITAEWAIRHVDVTNLVKTLAAQGKICDVLGHNWRDVPHITLEYRPDGNYPQHRKCVVCGRVETKEPGRWE